MKNKNPFHEFVLCLLSLCLQKSDAAFEMSNLMHHYSCLSCVCASVHVCVCICAMTVVSNTNYWFLFFAFSRIDKRLSIWYFHWKSSIVFVLKSQIKRPSNSLGMNRNQRATRNNPANKAFVSGGVISNFTGAQPNSSVQLPISATTVSQ